MKALLAALLLTGCAAVPEKPTYATRNCVITLGDRVNERAFSAMLFCDREQPVESKPDPR